MDRNIYGYYYFKKKLLLEESQQRSNEKEVQPNKFVLTHKKIRK